MVKWRILGVDGYAEGLTMYRAWQMNQLWKACFLEAHRAGIQVRF
jgi:hypothetical protein